ncbi:hypothetical protein Tco_1163098 [Tanacetum coccineum]
MVRGVAKGNGRGGDGEEKGRRVRENGRAGSQEGGGGRGGLIAWRTTSHARAVFEMGQGGWTEMGGGGQKGGRSGGKLRRRIARGDAAQKEWGHEEEEGRRGEVCRKGAEWLGSGVRGNREEVRGRGGLAETVKGGMRRVERERAGRGRGEGKRQVRQGGERKWGGEVGMKAGRGREGEGERKVGQERKKGRREGGKAAGEKKKRKGDEKQMRSGGRAEGGEGKGEWRMEGVCERKRRGEALVCKRSSERKEKLGGWKGPEATYATEGQNELNRYGGERIGRAYRRSSKEKEVMRKGIKVGWRDGRETSGRKQERMDWGSKGGKEELLIMKYGKRGADMGGLMKERRRTVGLVRKKGVEGKGERELLKSRGVGGGDRGEEEEGEGISDSAMGRRIRRSRGVDRGVEPAPHGGGSRKKSQSEEGGSTRGGRRGRGDSKYGGWSDEPTRPGHTATAPAAQSDTHPLHKWGGGEDEMSKGTGRGIGQGKARGGQGKEGNEGEKEVGERRRRRRGNATWVRCSEGKITVNGNESRKKHRFENERKRERLGADGVGRQRRAKRDRKGEMSGQNGQGGVAVGGRGEKGEIGEWGDLRRGQAREGREWRMGIERKEHGMRGNGKEGDGKGPRLGIRTRTTRVSTHEERMGDKCKGHGRVVRLLRGLGEVGRGGGDELSLTRRGMREDGGRKVGENERKEKESMGKGEQVRKRGKKGRRRPTVEARKRRKRKKHEKENKIDGNEGKGREKRIGEEIAKREKGDNNRRKRRDGAEKEGARTGNRRERGRGVSGEGTREGKRQDTEGWERVRADSWRGYYSSQESCRWIGRLVSPRQIPVELHELAIPPFSR